jgi:hypothetical protein
VIPHASNLYLLLILAFSHGVDELDMELELTLEELELELELMLEELELELELMLDELELELMLEELELTLEELELTLEELELMLDELELELLFEEEELEEEVLEELENPNSILFNWKAPPPPKLPIKNSDISEPVAGPVKVMAYGVSFPMPPGRFSFTIAKNSLSWINIAAKPVIAGVVDTLT